MCGAFVEIEQKVLKLSSERRNESKLDFEEFLDRMKQSGVEEKLRDIVDHYSSTLLAKDPNHNDYEDFWRSYHGQTLNLLAVAGIRLKWMTFLVVWLEFASAYVWLAIYWASADLHTQSQNLRRFKKIALDAFRSQAVWVSGSPEHSETSFKELAKKVLLSDERGSSVTDCRWLVAPPLGWDGHGFAAYIKVCGEVMEFWEVETSHKDCGARGWQAVISDPKEKESRLREVLNLLVSGASQFIDKKDGVSRTPLVRLYWSDEKAWNANISEHLKASESSWTPISGACRGQKGWNCRLKSTEKMVRQIIAGFATVDPTGAKEFGKTHKKYSWRMLMEAAHAESMSVKELLLAEIEKRPVGSKENFEKLQRDLTHFNANFHLVEEKHGGVRVWRPCV